MKLTRTEFKFLKESEMLSPKDFPFRRNLLEPKRARTIGELLQAACPENEEFDPLTYHQRAILNSFALEVSSIEDIENWIAERS